MTIREFEFTFEIEPISETVEDRAADAIDAFFFSRGETQFVTVSAMAGKALAAAMKLLGELHELGIHTLRFVEDLVGRREIANRTGVSPQNVGQWIRGERHGDVTFPERYTNTSADLWLWRDVQDFLSELGVTLDEPLGPSRAEIPQISGAVCGMHDGDTLEYMTNVASFSLGSATVSGKLGRGLSNVFEVTVNVATHNSAHSVEKAFA